VLRSYAQNSVRNTERALSGRFERAAKHCSLGGAIFYGDLPASVGLGDTARDHLMAIQEHVAPMETRYFRGVGN
jgi:hypothetical protein